MKERSKSSSRRRFLGSVLAAAAGLDSMAVGGARASQRSGNPDRARLERIALRYGSELGDVRRPGRERS